MIVTMPSARLPKRSSGRALIALLVLFAFVRLAPHLASNYRFIIMLRPAYRDVLMSDTVRPDTPCSGWDERAGSHLTAGQRLAASNLLRAAGCPDQAAAILPQFAVDGERPALLAHQWGLLALEQGDTLRAVAFWRQVPYIDQYLLGWAYQLRSTDLEAAQRWYEAAIMAVNSTPLLAHAIATYTSEMRQLVGTPRFIERLTSLEAFFGPGTAAGYRLRGQRLAMSGAYRAAADQLAQAIALGMDDAETWYWLGEAELALGDVAAAENAYRQAIASPIQIAWRRPWHLDRLAGLLSRLGRPREALPYQEEAVHLNNYYYYSDSLALLYAQLGDENQAKIYCRRARQLAGSAEPIPLRCEQP